MQLLPAIFGPHGTPQAPEPRRTPIRAIDNGFYRLPDTLARKLTIDGELPRHGYEKRAKAPAELNRLVQRTRWNYRVTPQRWENCDPIPESAQVWIQRTPLSWHDGKAIPRGWVWALHVWTPV